MKTNGLRRVVKTNIIFVPSICKERTKKTSNNMTVPDKQKGYLYSFSRPKKNGTPDGLIIIAVRDPVGMCSINYSFAKIWNPA